MISTRLSSFVARASLTFSRSISSAASGDVVVKEEHPYVYHLKLNRDKKMNTFTMDMWKEFKNAIDGLAENPKCRSIVISGEGRAFCAGIDIAGGMMEIVNIIQDDSIEFGRKGRKVRNMIGTIQDCFTALEKCPKPIIAAVHSYCIGAGIDLITACDIRVASQDAVFSIKEVDVGLAADIGTLNRIQKVVGNDSWTRELAFTARDFGVDEALKFGLISRIYANPKDTVNAALDLAKTISEKSPIAVQGTKETLNYARNHPTDQSLDFIKTWNMSQLLSTDLMNSAMAIMNKKKATFEPISGTMFNTGKFVGRTALITGASRGIGKEIALKLAKDGANIVIAAKTATAHPKLPGTIYTAAEEIEKAGGKALPCIVDVRDETSVKKAVEDAVKKFGGIDILINNASAISLTNTEDTEMKRYDLMHSINTRGTYLMTKTCLPYLKQGKNPHVLNISPPLLMEPRWFSNHVAYTMAKYGMSMCVLGHHEEFKPYGIAVNALWPLTAIWTAAMEMLSNKEGEAGSRKPEIMADAAYAILSKNSKDFTGQFLIDQDVLRAEGVTDFDRYACVPGHELMPDFFIPGKYDAHFGFGKKSSSKKNHEKAVIKEEITQVLESVKSILNAEIVKSVGTVYTFELTGENPRRITVDLKNGTGAIFEGASDKATVTMTMADSDFAPLFQGKLKPSAAFMAKKLKISGDLSAALKLENVLKKMNSKL
ncbi:unnamed protein product [Caenorhabditis bovis]|uniref:Delta(3,5)-Delta(2,4)-dienoyl-CoA isomerase, mitochondrial n=1 Tax=Caenorhabditis bovis TaxID=2654633 RepID=A0A8S1ERW3_9PELO|nr:unnamed protein product [Caenorhabditis bovis]